jgi:hypothetical protein
VAFQHLIRTLPIVFVNVTPASNDRAAGIGRALSFFAFEIQPSA